MRFISRYPALQVSALKPEFKYVRDASGDTRKEKVFDGYIAQFRLGGLSPWEKQTGLARWKIATPLDGRVDGFLSSWDSEVEQIKEGWSDETREKVEKALLSSASAGTGNVIMVEPPKIEKPWPKYDDLHAGGKHSKEDIAKLIANQVKELGLDPYHVISYERENKDRSEVIGALEIVISEMAAEELLEPTVVA